MRALGRRAGPAALLPPGGAVGPAAPAGGRPGGASCRRFVSAQGRDGATHPPLPVSSGPAAVLRRGIRRRRVWFEERGLLARILPLPPDGGGAGGRHDPFPRSGRAPREEGGRWVPPRAGLGSRLVGTAAEDRAPQGCPRVSLTLAFLAPG